MLPTKNRRHMEMTDKENFVFQWLAKMPTENPVFHCEDGTRTNVQAVKMEVSDADGEWSEGTDDAHKSATTSGSEMEESPQPPLPFLPAMIPMLQKSMSMDQLMVKPSITKAKSCDAVDRIMDRIDAEINSMTNWQAPPFMKRKRPSKSERSQLKKLGVEFDTGDETAAEATLKEGLAKVNADKCEKDTDTGVGTGSIVDEAVSDSEPVQPKHKHIKGKVHTYADAAESEGNLTEDDPQRHHSDLDSDTAQQLEEKFQHIMKKKSGGYLRDLKVGPKMYSDQDSIKTEEFEEKFREVMMGPSREVMMAHSTSQLSAHSRQSKPSETRIRQLIRNFVQTEVPIPVKVKAKVPRKSPDYLAPPAPRSKRKDSDPESIRTEDFEREFKKTLQVPELHVIPPSKKSRTKVKGRGSVRHRSSGKTSGTSDLESVMTEDFERQFHNMMVKQVAQVPITSFDQLIVDSDLDTIQSEVIHDKFRQALSHSLNYDGSDVSSSETEATMEAYLEKKYQDILRKHKPGRHGSRTPSDAGTADGHHGHRGSPRRPVEPLSDTDHRDSETDGEGSAVNRTAVPSRRSHHKGLRHTEPPPPLWEEGSSPETHQYHHRHRTGSHGSHDSTQSTMSTFEEVESLDLSKSQSLESNTNQCSSPSNTQSVSSPSRTSSRPSSRNAEDGSEDRYHGRSSARGRWKAQKQQSFDRMSHGTSNTTSTFEEVESIDFGGAHELDLDPIFGIGHSHRDYIHEDPYAEDRHSRHDHYSRRYSRDKEKQIEDYLKRNSTNVSGSGHGGRSRHRGRDLIIPDESPDGDIPFSSHTFNKRPHGAESEKSDHSKSVKGKSQRNLFEKLSELMEYKQGHPHHAGSDTVSNSSMLSSSTHHGDTANMRLPFESEYEYHVRKRRQSRSSPSGSGSLTGSSVPSSGMMSRAMSLESNSSSNVSSSSPSDMYMQGFYNQPANAEQILLNLGFCATDSFLPERFARDWFEKLVKQRQEQIQLMQQQELADMLENAETTSCRSTSQASTRSTPKRVRSIADLLHKIDSNSRHFANSRRAKFRRAATILSYHQDQLSAFDAKQVLQKSKDSHTSLEKQDSLDELKYVLEKQAHILNHGTDKRRKQFASCHQKSLPLCLETLSEEDEQKSSRAPSFDAGRSKMKSFLEEGISSSSSKDSDFNIKQTDKWNQSGKESDSSPRPASTSTDTTECSDAEADHQDLPKIPPLHGPTNITTSTENPPNISDSYVNGNTSSELKPFPKPIPAIIISEKPVLTQQSSSSLEVAEIFDAPVLNGRLQVEPAMMSLVLSDVDDAPRKRLMLHQLQSGQNFLGSEYLNPPSPSSSFSLSPAPLSPITVIEMEHLDNQSDSIDADDSQGENRDKEHLSSSDDNPDNNFEKNMSTLQPISEEELHSSDQSHNTSPVESARSAGPSSTEPMSSSSVDSRFSMKDSSVDANDGRLSPIVTFTSAKLFSHLENFDGVDGWQCESAYGSSAEDHKGSSNVSMDIDKVDYEEKGIQQDDGTLSPIMFEPMYYSQMELDDSVCFVSDKFTQYDVAMVEVMVQHVEQTSFTEPVPTKGVECSTQTTDVCQPISPQFCDSASDIPMLYYTDASCQTDQPMSKGLTVPTSRTPLMHKFFCENCGQEAFSSFSVSQNSSLANSFDGGSPGMGQRSLSWNSVASAEGSDGSLNTYAGRKALDITIERLAKKTKKFRKRSITEILSVNELDREIQSQLLAVKSTMPGATTSYDSEDSSSPLPRHHQIAITYDYVDSCNANQHSMDASFSSEMETESGSGMNFTHSFNLPQSGTDRSETDPTNSLENDNLLLQHIQARRNSLKRQLSFELSSLLNRKISSGHNTETEKLSMGEHASSSGSEQIKSIPKVDRRTVRSCGSSFDRLSVHSCESTDYDASRRSSSSGREAIMSDNMDNLAASIVTDLFPNIDLEYVDDKTELLNEIAQDYSVVEAVNTPLVNTTLDHLLSPKDMWDHSLHDEPELLDIWNSNNVNSSDTEDNFGDSETLASDVENQNFSGSDANLPLDVTGMARYNSRSGATNGQCNSLAEDEAVVRNVQEIKEESARIQKEIEEERRMKMIPSSPKRATTPPREEFSSPHITKTMSSTPVRSPKTRTRIYTSTATSPIPFSLDSPKASKRASQDELKELLEMIRKAKQEKQTALHELRTVKDTVQLNQADLMRAEKQLKETRARAEDARTELMLAEFKRDSANKELDHAVQELKKKRERLKILDVQIEAEDTTDALQDAGFGREQVLALLAERDALRVQCEQHDNRELERQELERQLSSTKEELFAEQKRAREKIEALEEELEAIAQRYEDSSTEKEESHKTLTQLQAQCTLLEQEKQHLLREKTEESQRYGSREMTELRKQIQDGREQLNNVKAQLNSKDELNLQLREQMVALQQQVTKHAELRDAMDQQHRQEVNALQQEKEETVAKVKQAAVAEKEKAVSELKQQLDQSHLRQQEHLTDVQGTLASKEVELGMLKERLKNHDEIVLQLGDQIRQDTREQIRSVVEVEKQAWQAEKEKSWSQQKQELENKVHQLQEELDTEKHICEQQLKQVTSLKQELEEQRQKHRAAYRDRLTALNQSMEEAKEDRKREMEQVKETLGRESMKETERLRKDIQELEEEMEQLRLDKKELTQKNKEAVCQLEEMEKTIVYEINQECRRIAQELGITPRTTAATGYIPTYSPGGSALARSLGRSATTTALANLKASYDELLHHVEELKQELQTQKLTTQQLETKKREEVEVVRHRLQSEKVTAMEALKDRLIKEHLEEVEKLHETLGKDRSLARALKEKDKEITEIQRSMKKWKDETTEKLAKKFQEEMSRELEKRTKEFKKQHREWERERASLVREVDRLDRDMGRAALSQSAPFIGSGRGMDSETLRMLRQMQSKMKQLRTENSTLRRGIHNLSMPDLSTSAPLNSSMTEANLSMVDDERSVRRLEQQVQLSDHKAHLAEERAEKNQQLLNNKMLELSKLQATLTQQTKELMQLERAYSQLQQKAARSAARGPSTTR